MDNTEEIENLLSYRQEFERKIMFSQYRKERIEKLIARRSASRWSTKKRAKMFRRVDAAIAQLNQATMMFDQVNLRLDQLSET